MTELLEPSRLGPLAVACLGVWLHAADELLITTLSPAIVADIGGAALVAWTISLYELGSIVAGAAAALTAATLGVRAGMAGAALLYALGCAVSALAETMPVLLAGRLMQGVGGGGMMALSFVMVTRVFPPRLLPRVLAAISALWGSAAFVGPLVGGVFGELGLWRGAFWFFAVQAVGLALLVRRLLRDDHAASEEPPPRLPIWRLTALAGGVLAIASAGVYVAPVRSTLLVLLGVVLLALFLELDARRDRDRLLPLTARDLSTGPGAALLLVFAFSAATIAIHVYGPILMVTIAGVSLLTAGYVLALSSIGWSAAAILASGAPERRDPLLIWCGGLCLTASIFGFMVAAPAGAVAWIALFAALEGVGFGLAWTFILRRTLRLTSVGERDRLASAMPTTQRLGYAVGAALMGVAANAAGFRDGVSEADAPVVGAVVFAASLPLALIGLWALARLLSIKPAEPTAPRQRGPR